MPPSSRNSGYSASELSSMQRDAMERVREMQRRARARVEQSNRMVGGQPPYNPPPAPANLVAHPQTHQAAVPAAAPVGSGPPASHSAPVSHPPVQPSHPPTGGTTQSTPPAQPLLPFQGILERLNLDTETVLLGILLLLLINDGADRTLILALVYLLLF